MKPVATVLYEDSKIHPEFALHRLVLRMVEDDIDGQTWKLLKIVADNPKNGVDKLLADVRVTSLIAGEGRLFVLVDRDRIARHVNQNTRPGESQLPASATDDEIVAAVRRTSDAPDKLGVFLLEPNLEGLLAAIEHCAPGQWTADLASARRKDRFARDFVLAAAATATPAMASLRACLRDRQPGLGALAKALAQVIPAEVVA